jgi:hypothetical protein
MASLLKPWITRYVDERGERCRKGDPGARKIRERSDTWYGQYRDAAGRTRRVPLSADKSAAQIKLGDLVKKAAMGEAGAADPYEEHRGRPLSGHLDDYRKALEAEGNTPRHVAKQISRCGAIAAGCRFRTSADLDAHRIKVWLSERRKASSAPGAGGRPFGLATSNHYITAIKGFGAWLAKAKRIDRNPLSDLSKLDAGTDMRRERRALSASEMAEILAAALSSAKSFGGLTGPDRAVLYAAAVSTGYRVEELASLTPESLGPDAEAPTVTLEAAAAKNGRRHV